jgi:hypothetical protein
MIRMRPVRRPQEGCFDWCALRCKFGRSQARADRYSGAPVDSVSNCRVCEACERRPGEILVKAFAGWP